MLSAVEARFRTGDLSEVPPGLAVLLETAQASEGCASRLRREPTRGDQTVRGRPEPGLGNEDDWGRGMFEPDLSTSKAICPAASLACEAGHGTAVLTQEWPWMERNRLGYSWTDLPSFLSGDCPSPYIQGLRRTGNTLLRNYALSVFVPAISPEALPRSPPDRD